MGCRISTELLKALPKTDLHVHLDGSIRPDTLIELAAEQGASLPAETPEGLHRSLFRESYSSLEEYLEGFGYSLQVMQSPLNLSRIAYELALDNQAEGVRYVEVRFAPQLHMSSGMSSLDAFNAVNDGFRRAKEEFNSRHEVVSGKEPHFDYGIIACSLRAFDDRSSGFHSEFLAMHRYTDPDRVYGLASLELVGAAVHARDEMGLPVVGIDLAGPEKGFPPVHHREAYHQAQRHFLKKTVHAGEAYGPESIFQAITELNADRIGHGTSLFNADAVKDPSISDPQRYVDRLVQYVADRRITIEVCLSSNLQTSPAIDSLGDHPFGKMMEHRLSVAICTDNRTVSRTTVTDELQRAIATFDLSEEQLKNLIVYGFKRSFFPGDYADKRCYVRECMEYFERLMAGS